jgi:hypothetical protein
LMVKKLHVKQRFQWSWLCVVGFLSNRTWLQSLKM